MQEIEPLYNKLRKHTRETKVLESTSRILQWDQETKMPTSAAPIRSEQLELLSHLIHEKQTHTSFKKNLEKLIDLETGNYKVDHLSSEQKRSLDVWRRDFLLLSKLPTSFVTEFTKLTSLSIHAWAQAKKEDAFSQFSPFLEKIVSLSRKKADYLGYHDHPYDALIDEYEPEMTTQKITSLFSQLKKPILKLRSQILEKKTIDDSVFYKRFSKDKQLKLAKQVLHQIGFSDQNSRLDESNHPFCMPIHPSDIRPTTHVKERFFPFCLLSTMHEAGHGLYESNIPQDLWDTPIGRSISLGIHESQSRLWETRIGQSMAFAKYFYPYIQKTFPSQFQDISLNKFYKAINKVTNSPIRVDSDEVSYSLHIILRFEMEVGLIEGSIKVRDIPEVWNEKMQEYFGFTPKANSEGCLQDIHWAFGLIGYFPTYTLGNIYAAQFFETFAQTYPDWESRVAKGDLAFLSHWLKEHIHQPANRYPAETLVKKVTGDSLKDGPFLSYLMNKYSEIYRLY